MNTIKRMRNAINIKRLIRNIKFLLKNDLEEIQYKVKDEAIEDVIYEFEEDKTILSRLCIFDEDETLRLLENNPKSFARFGDGEIDIIRGFDGVFQKYDLELAKRLKNILINKNDSIYVGLNPSYFESPLKFSEANKKFYRLKGTSYRRFLLDTCSKDVQYLDACCFGGYFRHNDDYDFAQHYQRIENLFKGKSIVVVCGQGVKDEVSFDVFKKAKQVKIVEAPRRDAYSSFDKIVSDIKSIAEESDLICISLGMTATAMVVELSEAKYMAWDVGHMIQDFCAWKQQVEKSEKNIHDFFCK